MKDEVLRCELLDHRHSLPFITHVKRRGVGVVSCLLSTPCRSTVDLKLAPLDGVAVLVQVRLHVCTGLSALYVGVETGATAWVYMIEEAIVCDGDLSGELQEHMEMRFPILVQFSAHLDVF